MMTQIQIKQGFITGGLSLALMLAMATGLTVAPVSTAEAACQCAHTPAVNNHTSKEHRDTVRKINEHTTNEINDVIYAIYLAAQTIAGTIDTAQKAQIENDANNRADMLEAQTQSDKDIAKTQAAMEQAPSPDACRSVQAAQIAGGLSEVAKAVRTEIADSNNRRNRNMTRDTSTTSMRAATARLGERLNLFCGERNVAAGECELAENPIMRDGDLRAGLFFDEHTYDPETSMLAARAFSENVTNPVPPPPLTNQQMRDMSSAMPRVDRNKRDARMSLAQSVFELQIAERVPSTDPDAIKYGVTIAKELGKDAYEQATGGELGQMIRTQGLSRQRLLELEIDRRFHSPKWMIDIEKKPPSSVIREMAKLQALQLYISFRQYELDQRTAAIQAAQLAIAAEQDYGSRTPAGSIGSVDFREAAAQD